MMPINPMKRRVDAYIYSFFSIIIVVLLLFILITQWSGVRFGEETSDEIQVYIVKKGEEVESKEVVAHETFI